MADGWSCFIRLCERSRVCKLARCAKLNVWKETCTILIKKSRRKLVVTWIFSMLLCASETCFKKGVPWNMFGVTEPMQLYLNGYQHRLAEKNCRFYGSQSRSNGVVANAPGAISLMAFDSRFKCCRFSIPLKVSTPTELNWLWLRSIIWEVALKSELYVLLYLSVRKLLHSSRFQLGNFVVAKVDVAKAGCFRGEVASHVGDSIPG